MTQEIIEFASEIFPFRNVKQKTITDIFSEYDFKIADFQKNETVFSKNNYRKTVGFIIDGKCEVERERSSGDSIPLNSLTRYSSFGILSVFSQGAEFPTVIKAVTPCKIMFISGEDMISIVKKYRTVALNIITFLSDRIAFLNNKIETFSEKSTCAKLASYLLAKYKAFGNEIVVSRTKLSAELGVGRASLYRDLDTLVNKNLIKTDKKRIIIICPEGLERI